MIEWLVKRTSTYKELEQTLTSVNIENFNKQKKIGLLNNEIIDLKSKVTNLTVELNEREHQRRASAGKVGGLKAKINSQEKEISNLKEQLEEKDKLLADANRKVDFLKNNRRSPNLEELKDYEQRRKRSIYKNNS